MYVLNSNITIAGKRFDGVHEVEIITSGKVLQDTAIIKVPTTARIERAGEFVTETPTASAFNVGDEVVIELGYNGDLKEEFRGYVKRINPTTPLSIECEDATFLLRKTHVNKSWQSVTLKQVLTEVLKDTGVSLAKEPPLITFSQFYLRDVSPAQALQEFIEKYGLTIYFTSFKKLFVGLAFDSEDRTTVKYDIGTNVIENDLQLVDADDVQLRVKCVGIKPDGTKITAEIGDGADPDEGLSKRKKANQTVIKPTKSDGAEVRTLYFYNVHSKSELLEIARAELRKRKFTGYKGGLTTFLLPFVQVGNVARLTDRFYPERGDGDYLIEKVTTTFGTSGARRKVELGLKFT